MNRIWVSLFIKLFRLVKLSHSCFNFCTIFKYIDVSFNKEIRTELEAGMQPNPSRADELRKEFRKGVKITVVNAFDCFRVLRFLLFSRNLFRFGQYRLREAAKKVIFLMAGPLRPNPPPPSSLMAVEILERWKKRLKKSFFFLNGPALYPTPLLMARPLRRGLFFGFPS